MERELEKLQRANAELQAWVRDLLAENRVLRTRLAADETGALEPVRRDGPTAAPVIAACS